MIYIENLVKHIKPGTVVCGTRIEPPLHPEGKEKIIRDFGMDFDTLNIDNPKTMLIIGISGAVGKFVTNFFAE